MDDKNLHYKIREGDTSKLDVVTCPYDWMTIRKNTYQVNQYELAKQIIFDYKGAVQCAGYICAIYPCERVRKFAGLE